MKMKSKVKDEKMMRDWKRNNVKGRKEMSEERNERGGEWREEVEKGGVEEENRSNLKTKERVKKDDTLQFHLVEHNFA
jgi:hypothetical protein